MKGMDKISKKPVKITDTTFRDGHQSTLATRMRTEDMVPIAAELDQVGFYSVEVWGGATFDVTHRFLGEDPWERVRVLKKLMPKTPFQMLLRGQNLVAYRNHPDDLVEAFIEKSAEVGIDIFRCFDAVNDERNFEMAFKVIKKVGKHIQGTICYSLTERKMGGPVYNLDYYLKKAKVLEEMGADSLCIKDMAGLLAPYDVYELVKALKEKVKMPIQLHTHYTSGMGSMTYLEGDRGGGRYHRYVLGPLCSSVLTACGGADHRGLGGDAVGYGPGSFEAIEIRGIFGDDRAEVSGLFGYDEDGGDRYGGASASDTRGDDIEHGESA